MSNDDATTEELVADLYDVLPDTSPRMRRLALAVLDFCGFSMDVPDHVPDEWTGG
jgi:hypothetical protein